MYRCASRMQTDSDSRYQNPNICFMHVDYCSTMQKSNMLTNSDRTIINTFQHIKTSDDIALDDSTNFWHIFQIKYVTSCWNYRMQMDPTTVIFALSLLNHMFNTRLLTSDRQGSVSSRCTGKFLAYVFIKRAYSDAFLMKLNSNSLHVTY